MVLDISGINFFMPVFSFLFVFVVIYAVLLKTKIIGEEKFFLAFVAFIMAIIFMSFSSMEPFVETIVPWAIILLVMVFLVLLIAGFSTKDLDKIMTTRFAWAVIIILIIIFLIAAIRVFNPVFHPQYIISSGGGPGIGGQIIYFIFYSQWAGSILLLIIAGIVAWVITRGGK